MARPSSKSTPAGAAPGVVAQRGGAVPATSQGDPTEYTRGLRPSRLDMGGQSGQRRVPCSPVARRKTTVPPGAARPHGVRSRSGRRIVIVECCRLAADIADILKHETWYVVPKTSGSKGLQLYVPLAGHPTWDKVREDAHRMAVQLEHDHPNLVVSNMRRSLRRGKVLIDWSQNHPAKTTVAAYSLRARPDPTVSTPVTWEEVEACADAEDPDSAPFHRPGRARPGGPAGRPLRPGRRRGLD